jgi:rubrerythrin
MGRTVPTFRQRIEEAAQHWAKFRRALRHEEQAHFDRLFLCVRSYTQAATYQASDNPMEAILLAIALEQEKRIAALERLAERGKDDHAAGRLDSGSLPFGTGDDAVAADGGTDGPQTD